MKNSFVQDSTFVLLYDIDPGNFSDGGAKVMGISVTNDLYICLNGHIIKGIRFLDITAKTVYITKCSTEKSIVIYGVDSLLLRNNINLEIYGINKNLEIKYDKLAH